MSGFRFGILIVFLVLVSGCAYRVAQPDSHVDLPTQLVRLRAIENWEISGKLAVKHPDRSLSANLRWQTQQQDFQFRLTNFLGVTLVDMDSSPTGASLTTDGETHMDPSANRLLYRMTGWDIPINQLMSWIKGVPLISDRYQLGELGLLSSLTPACGQCDGWQVRYSKYQQVKDLWLPQTLVLSNSLQPDHSIKIRIDKWILK